MDPAEAAASVSNTTSFPSSKKDWEAAEAEWEGQRREVVDRAKKLFYFLLCKGVFLVLGWKCW